jgi:hypothetical protein
MRGRVFDTPKNRLFLARWWPQQRSVAAAHQSETALNQANGPSAQIVGSPVAFGNAPGIEQDFCNFAISAAVHARIERAQGERQSSSAMRGKRV